MKKKTTELKRKLRDWCEDNDKNLLDFLESLDLQPNHWYRILNGISPNFSTVSKIVHGTNGYISYEDFEVALELREGE